MRQLKIDIPRIKESWNGDCLFEIQAIHRKCIRLLIITAHFNLRSRHLKLRLLNEGENWSPPIQHLSLLTDLCFNNERVFKVLYYMVKCWTIKQGGAGHGELTAITQGPAGQQSAGGEQLCCASLVLYIVIITVIPSFSFLLNCIYLSPQVFTFFQFSLQSHWGGSFLKSEHTNPVCMCIVTLTFTQDSVESWHKPIWIFFCKQNLSCYVTRTSSEIEP